MVVPNAVAAASLGRSLSSCPATGTCSQVVTVPTIAFGNVSTGTVFDLRLNQIDMRLAKIIKFGRGRIAANADLYNIANTRPPQGNVTTYGASWLRPTSLLGGRLLKFSADVAFKL